MVPLNFMASALIVRAQERLAIQLFRETSSGKRAKLYATVPKGDMGYPRTVAVEPSFVAFSLMLVNIRPWLLVRFLRFP